MVTTRSASKGTASPSPSVSGRSGGGRAVRNSGGGRVGAAAAAGSGSGSGSGAFTHAPTWATLAWLAVSVPLVVWDSLYVLLRPLTMEGGALHWPLWVPYRLYGEVDHVYGWKAFRARSGFTAAQGSLNVAETALYLAYVAIYYLARAETRQGRGLQQQQQGAAPRAKVLSGRPAAVAVLLAFSSAVMTLSKTVLYWLNEYFSGFDNIGHNSWQDLIPLWIIPNGAWLVLPTYMIYVLGGEIIEGLTAGSTGVAVKSE